MLRLGVNPILWSNDDLQSLGGATPLEQCLREAEAAGYDGIELGHKFPRDPVPLREILAPHGLALVSGWHSAQLGRRSVEAELEALGPHLDLLAAMRSEVVIVAECSGTVHSNIAAPLTDRPLLDDAGWERLTSALDTVAAAVRARGMRLAYHHHMGTVVQTSEEIDRLVRSTSDDVGLLLDTGHLLFAGAEPLAAARRWAERIVHVHCKDVRRDVLASLPPDASFLNAVCAGVFTVPGDGSIDYEPILAALAAKGYSGWLVVEADQDPAKAPPAVFAKQGHDHLRAAARRTRLLTS